MIDVSGVDPYAHAVAEAIVSGTPCAFELLPGVEAKRVEFIGCDDKPHHTHVILADGEEV